MKQIIFGIFFSAILTVNAAEKRFEPGGVSVSLAEYTAPQAAEGTKVLMTEDFEDIAGISLQRTNQESLTGHWFGNFWLHGTSQAEKSTVAHLFRTSIENGIGVNQSAAGKIVTDTGVESLNPERPETLYVSNRLSKTIKLPEYAPGARLRAEFKARAVFPPSKPRRHFSVIMNFHPNLTNWQSSKMEIRNMEVSGNWQNYQMECPIPPKTAQVALSMALYGCGEVVVDDIKVSLIPPPEKPGITIAEIPYDLTDKVYHVGENQPAMLTFGLHRPADVFPANPRLLLEVPEPFELAGNSRFFALLSSKKQAGATRYEFDFKALMPALYPMPRYNNWRMVPVMLTANAKAGEKQYPVYYSVAYDDYESPRKQIHLKIIEGTAAAQRPRIFKTGIVANSFEIGFDETGSGHYTDFYRHCGFNSLNANLNPVLAKKMKEAQIERYSTEWYMSDAYRLGAAPKDENSAFHTITGELMKDMVCPVNVYKKGEYFQTEIVPLLKRKIVEQDLADHFLPNWEPYKFDFKGCFCPRCFDEFAAYARIHPDELKKVWPKTVTQVMRDKWIAFRSWQHGQLIGTLENTVNELGKTAGKESHFIPAVSEWCFKPARGYGAQYAAKDYMEKLPWINPWGPYTVKRNISDPYIYFPARHLEMFFSAADIKKFVNENTSPEKRPQLIAYPHGFQSLDWLTEPEALAFETLSIFVNGWEGSFAYFFQPYDHRYWNRMAEMNTRIAIHEPFIFNGKRMDSAKVEILTPFIQPKHSKSWIEFMQLENYHPGISTASALQVLEWEKDSERLIAVGNFWERGEAFARLKVSGLPPAKRYLVQRRDRNDYFMLDPSRSYLTGEELGNGLIVHIGALRWEFFTVSEFKEVPSAVPVKQEYVKSLMEKRLPAIRDAFAAEEKLLAQTDGNQAPEFDFAAMPGLNEGDVKLTRIEEQGKRTIHIETPVYSATVEPAVGGRIASLKINGEEIAGTTMPHALALTGFYWPHSAICVIDTHFRISNVEARNGGIALSMERTLNAGSSPNLSGLRIRLVYHFFANHWTESMELFNPTERVMNFVPRRHYQFQYLGTRNGKTGSVQIGGQRFSRGLKTHMFVCATSNRDDRVEKSVKLDHYTLASGTQADLQAPFIKSKLQGNFSDDLYAFLFWDAPGQAYSSFEPIYKTVTLPQNAKWETAVKWTPVQ